MRGRTIADSLVEQVRDYAIIALDAQGIIRSWNDGAQALKGYTAAEAIGQHFSMFYPVADQRDGLPDSLLAEARETGRVEHHGWRVGKDGHLFWGDVIITAVHDDDGHLTGYAKVTRDLSEQHGLELARESFFAGLTHDLLVPVTAIKGLAELFAQADESDRVEFARRIEANADRLVRMVHDLADYALLSSGGLRLDLVEVLLDEATRDSVKELSAVLAGHHITVQDSGVTAMADRGVIGRIIGNLLINASKYSPMGSTIAVTFAADADTSRLAITDTGRGILPQDLERIFGEFERGDLAQSDGGTGLGLSSVRQLVALHGGKVWIESETGVGTTVTVELPAVA